MNDEAAEPRYPCDGCGALRTKAEGGTVFTVCDGCWDKRQRPPFAAELLSASRDQLIDEVIRLRGDLAACQRSTEEQGASMSAVSTNEEAEQRTQEAWATVPADLERLAEQCCDEYHGEIGTFQNFANDRPRWRDFAKFLWDLGARPRIEGSGR